jgi:mRNA interferase RelE/StbE
MFQIELTETSKSFLKKLQKKDSELILKKIYSIRDNPYRFLRRLQGEKLWRLRIGDYRVVVDVVISMGKIVVVRIGHGKNVYDYTI